MKTEWKDVIGMYLDCDLKTESGIVKLVGCEVDKFYGIYDAIVINGNVGHRIRIRDAKPILRKLSDMTEAEAKELDLADVQIGLLKFADRIQMFMTADQFNKMLKMGFDLFGLIDSGQAIDRTTLTSLSNK